MRDPNTTDITHGFSDAALAGFEQHHLEAVTTLLARASERAYRRGFQQGESIGRRRPGDLRQDLHAWRYGTSTDDSPWADAPHIGTSADRLFSENGGLIRLGLRVPMADAIMPALRHDPSYVAVGR